MEHILNEAELKELHDEYFSIADKVRELEHRQREIDATICRNSCNIVASRFIPLEIGDKVRVTRQTYTGLEHKPIISTIEGFFNSFYLEGHPYTVDNGVGRVKLRINQIKKDGTRSCRFDELYAGSVTNIEKID